MSDRNITSNSCPPVMGDSQPPVWQLRVMRESVKSIGNTAVTVRCEVRSACTDSTACTMPSSTPLPSVISKAELSAPEYITREIVPKVEPVNCTETADRCVSTKLSAVVNIAGMFSTTSVSTPDPSMGNWSNLGAWRRAHLPLGLMQFLPVPAEHAAHQRADNTSGDGTKYVNWVTAVLGAN
jgi:hypothetical protein